MARIFKMFIFTLVLSLFSIAQAKEVGGVEVAQKIENPPLILNGAGIRSKFFFDLYVGALYLQQKNSNAKEIIESNEPMAIRLHIISSLISSKKMRNATLEGFENSTNSNISPIKKEIDQFLSVFKDKIKKGDVYTFIYKPSVGTEIYKNGTLKSTIPGLDFKKALFGIWLGDKPAQKSLKKEMLGLD
jgi:hypothetical protein